MIDQRRAEHKAKRGVKEDYYRGTGEKVVARTKKFMDKKGQKGAPGLDAMKARAAEHKAKRGVKEEHQLVDFLTLKEYSPNVAYQAKGGKKSGKLGKSSVYSLRGKDESKKDFRKSHVKDVEGGYVGKGHKPTPGSLRKEEVIDERSLSSYIPSDRKAEFDAADREYMKAMMKKKEDESTKNRGNLRKRDAGKMAKERLHDKKHGAYKEEVVTELNRYGKETGKATGSINKRAGTPIKKGGSTDRALNYVRSKIRKETGKPEGQQKKVKGEKGRAQYGNRRTTPADSIAKRRQSRADAEKLMRDTSGT